MHFVWDPGTVRQWATYSAWIFAITSAVATAKSFSALFRDFSGPFMQYNRQEHQLSEQVNTYCREKQAGMLNKTVLLIQPWWHLRNTHSDTRCWWLYSHTPWTLTEEAYPCIRLIYLILLYLNASVFYSPLENVILLIFIHSPVFIIWILTLPFKSLQSFQAGVIQTLCKSLNK